MSNVVEQELVKTYCKRLTKSDTFDINITMTRNGKKFSLVKKRRNDCLGCAFYGFNDRCPRVKLTTISSDEFVHPCIRLSDTFGGNFVWKEVKA